MPWPPGTPGGSTRQPGALAAQQLPLYHRTFLPALSRRLATTSPPSLMPKVITSNVLSTQNLHIVSRLRVDPGHLQLYTQGDESVLFALGFDHHVGVPAAKGINKRPPVPKVHAVGVGAGLLLRVLA